MENAILDKKLLDFILKIDDPASAQMADKKTGLYQQDITITVKYDLLEVLDGLKEKHSEHFMTELSKRLRVAGYDIAAIRRRRAAMKH